MGIVEKKMVIVKISVTMIASVLVVALLAWNGLKDVNGKHGFLRSFVSALKNTKVVNIIDREKDIIDMAGFTNNQVYFKTKDPSKIYITDHSLLNAKYQKLGFVNTKKMTSRFDCIVDSPNVSIMAGNAPAIVVGAIDTTHVVYSFPPKIFLRSIKIPNDTYVFRGFDTTVKTTDPIFFKGNPITGRIDRSSVILEKKNDAGISTDGQLHYDRKTNSIVYVFFYKNQFLHLDTNLNLLHQGKTVDTFSILQTDAKNIETQNLITNIVPRRVINAASCVYDGCLYNSSKIIADNETSVDFANHSVVDIYDLINNVYKGSFYIPTYRNEKMMNFKVYKNSIIALYKSYIIKYEMPVLAK